MTITNSINICDVNIDIISGPIGVCHSGGADSALILYLIMKHASGPIHVYTCSSQQKHNIAPRIALNVILKCMELTGKRDVFHHTFFVETQTLKSLLDPIISDIKKHDLQMVYNGVTAFPSVDTMNGFKNKIPDIFDRRDPTVKRSEYQGTADIPFYSPLTNVNKKKVFEMYQSLEILDTIYPITRSCESLTLTEGHCGVCWWCEERFWAFNKYS
jgi:7-cyano-7-deazaguanine synthase in queuosine biosynthesis